MLRLGRKVTALLLRALRSTTRSAAIQESTLRDLCNPGVWNDHNTNRDISPQRAQRNTEEHRGLAASLRMVIGYCDPRSGNSRVDSFAGETMAQDSVSQCALWTGRARSAFPILIVLMGSVMKLMRLPAVHEGFARAGLS